MTIDKLIEYTPNALCKVIYPPAWGRQDQGLSPGGPVDGFSYESGNVMLGQSSVPALEFIIPPDLTFASDCWFVLTGAAYDLALVSKMAGQSAVCVNHGTVYHAQTGDRLQFGRKKYGFRSYLCLKQFDGMMRNLAGRKRDRFDSFADWSAPANSVRVIKGPEYNYLVEPADFLHHPWKISLDSNDMGIRLEHYRKMPRVALENMVSGVVSDGTVQLTPGGPIILLRNRQTIGGYPRVFNVISTDLDKLAQFIPGQIIRFEMVSLARAEALLQQREKTLQTIKTRFNNPDPQTTR